MATRQHATLQKPGLQSWIPARLNEMLAADPAGARPIHAAISIALIMMYGGAMGSFGLWENGSSANNWLQVLYSAVKVPLLLGATFALSLPCFFVFNAIAGVAGDFREVMKTLVATQSPLSVLLGSLSPLTLMMYASGGGYLTGVLFNAAMFAAASLGILPVVRRNYRLLIRRNPTHRRMAALWMLLYSFVGIQMGWSLRPFIGDPNNVTEFFRSNGWGNAYVVILEILMNATTLSTAYGS